MELTGLDGKVALVTGAGRMRSIGRQIALTLAQAGCHVIVTGTGRSLDRLPPDETAAGWRDIESVADEIRGLGRRALPVVSSVSDENDVQRLATVCANEFGRVDFLVNNAGAALGDDRKPVTELETQSWKRVINTNLTGTFLMSRQFGRQMVADGDGGCIVNISSIAGKLLPPNSAAYAASKAGVQALSACMAQEVGSAGVRVNAVCPGYVETSRMDGVQRTVMVETVAKIALGRPGQPTDVAPLVAYLCSDQGAWVTGQAWNIDGGHAVQH